MAGSRSLPGAVVLRCIGMHMVGRSAGKIIGPGQGGRPPDTSGYKPGPCRGKYLPSARFRPAYGRAAVRRRDEQCQEDALRGRITPGGQVFGEGRLEGIDPDPGTSRGRGRARPVGQDRRRTRFASCASYAALRHSPWVEQPPQPGFLASARQRGGMGRACLHRVRTSTFAALTMHAGRPEVPTHWKCRRPSYASLIHTMDVGGKGSPRLPSGCRSGRRGP